MPRVHVVEATPQRLRARYDWLERSRVKGRVVDSNIFNR